LKPETLFGPALTDKNGSQGELEFDAGSGDDFEPLNGGIVGVPVLMVHLQ
jgi:hypothetical protein